MSVETHNLATAQAATAPATAWSTTETLQGEALKRAVYKLEAETRARIMERQNGVPTFSGVLTYFHQFFTTGDYVVVEDSGSKHEAIGKFLARHSGCYKLDTRYTDFFGRNATCARDSIFVRI